MSLTKGDYRSYITSAEWRDKHKYFLKCSRYRCSFFPFILAEQLPQFCSEIGSWMVVSASADQGRFSSCIVSKNSEGRLNMSKDQSNEKLFFYDSLIEVYEVVSGKTTGWGFTVFFDNKIEYGESICETPEDAVSSAKLDALCNFVKRSAKISWLTVCQLGEPEVILSLSPSAIKRFGNIDVQFFSDLCIIIEDRAAFLQKVALTGVASSPVKTFDLDGRLIEGMLTSQLIKRGKDIPMLLEEFTPQI